MLRVQVYSIAAEHTWHVAESVNLQLNLCFLICLQKLNGLSPADMQTKYLQQQFGKGLSSPSAVATPLRFVCLYIYP